ncbi:MAG: hypothetical protein KF878_34150 [Planctomycetes bacterium]|nr:hypothetical protein [Planctomycetota bacterium]
MRRLGQWAAVIAGPGEALGSGRARGARRPQADAHAALAREAAVALEHPRRARPSRAAAGRAGAWPACARPPATTTLPAAGAPPRAGRGRATCARRSTPGAPRSSAARWPRRAAGQPSLTLRLTLPAPGGGPAGLVGLPTQGACARSPRASQRGSARRALGPCATRENRAFLARLRARGLDPRAWVEGLPARAWTPPGGPRLTLRLEDDPLEVLRMGEPFRTCLAPGAFNFFAALVDAADVNKRVLYARRDDGGIVGRCLLALTDAGALLTYHPYCHDAALGFVEQVRAFVQDLAAAVKTTVAASGDVSTLLAADWYCDEPEDLVGARPITADALREVLASATPDDVAARLEDALGPALDGEVLARVLALSTLEERPALALGLAPLVVTRRAPPRARVAAAERPSPPARPRPPRALVHGVRPEQVDAPTRRAWPTLPAPLGRAHAAPGAAAERCARRRGARPELPAAAWVPWARPCTARPPPASTTLCAAPPRRGEAARARCRARLEALSRARAG